MLRTITLLVISTLFFSCNDGDVITTTFNFDNASLESCTGGNNSFLFYKINDASNESISFLFEGSSDTFVSTDTTEVALDGSSSLVNYRIYNGEVTSSYFCNEIPPTVPQTTSEYIGNSGTALLITLASYNDQDGIDTEEEGFVDTDEDGILDYFDFDDDGDNVPTFLELDTENADGDNNPLTNPKDTDGDNIPDYLDEDDDGDGILTRYEDTDMNLDPTDDIDDPSVGPNFLNAAVTKSTQIDAYREHVFDFSTDITLKIENLVLINENEQITYETLNFGTIDSFFSGMLSTTPSF